MKSNWFVPSTAATKESLGGAGDDGSLYTEREEKSAYTPLLTGWLSAK